VRRRFFVDQFIDNTALMQGEAAHHLGRVLRAQPGQLYELSDGQRVWLSRVENVDRERISFALVEELEAYRPAVNVVLLLSIVKFDALEWALEKATELGVNTIVPLAAARSEKALLAAASKRAERWKKILFEASQQSRRVRLPILTELAKPEQAFTSQQAELRIVLSERADAKDLRAIIEPQPHNATSASLAIGPEGGWTDAELEAARAVNFSEASLGRAILRTETAVVAALASLNYALNPASTPETAPSPSKAT
jgi:16S rRNA (uracil1498-N3)-methyltransferase